MIRIIAPNEEYLQPYIDVYKNTGSDFRKSMNARGYFPGITSPTMRSLLI